jgi:hypothetical protein
MAQSDPVDPKVKKSFSRILAGVHETLCEKLDLKKVGEQLTAGKELRKRIRSGIKNAMRNKDLEEFYSVLQAFDLKSFVFFLKVLDSTAAENPGHKEILTILFHNLEELSMPSEVVAQLHGIRSKYVNILCQNLQELHVEDIVLYYDNEPEIYSFNKSDDRQHILHSPTHDVTVCVKNAFPKHLEKFDVVLTVNDYSQPITIPAEYTGEYSDLINLKCDPHFDKFQDYVTVTLSHCAIGNLDNLCVLTAADGDCELAEDLDIEIDDIDRDYITFRTLHFSNSMVSATKQRRQKYRRRSRATGLRTAISLDQTARRSSVETRPRSFSSPGTGGDETDGEFCVKMCRPCDTSRLSHWRVVFIVTANKTSLTKVRAMLCAMPASGLQVGSCIVLFSSVSGNDSNSTQVPKQPKCVYTAW